MWSKQSVTVLVLTFCLCAHAAKVNVIEAECNLPTKLLEEIKSYRGVANRIINEIVHGKYAGVTYQKWV